LKKHEGDDNAMNIFEKGIPDDGIDIMLLKNLEPFLYEKIIDPEGINIKLK
jgi:hypothetical protein